MIISKQFMNENGDFDLIEVGEDEKIVLIDIIMTAQQMNNGEITIMLKVCSEQSLVVPETWSCGQKERGSEITFVF